MWAILVTNQLKWEGGGGGRGPVKMTTTPSPMISQKVAHKRTSFGILVGFGYLITFHNNNLV